MDIGSILFFGFGFSGILFALWYNRRYRRLLEARLLEWADSQHFEIITYHQPRVWRGALARYGRGDGVFDVQMRTIGSPGGVRTARVVIKAAARGFGRVFVEPEP